MKEILIKIKKSLEETTKMINEVITKAPEPKYKITEEDKNNLKAFKKGFKTMKDLKKGNVGTLITIIDAMSGKELEKTVLGIEDIERIIKRAESGEIAIKR